MRTCGESPGRASCQSRVDRRVNQGLTVNPTLTERRTQMAAKPVHHCSFCAKAQTEVKILVAGPGVFICNECVDLSLTIIAKHSKTTTENTPSLLPDKAPTETLLKTLSGYNGAFASV